MNKFLDKSLMESLEGFLTKTNKKKSNEIPAEIP